MCSRAELDRHAGMPIGRKAWLRNGDFICTRSQLRDAKHAFAIRRDFPRLMRRYFAGGYRRSWNSRARRIRNCAFKSAPNPGALRPHGRGRNDPDQESAVKTHLDTKIALPA